MNTPKHIDLLVKSDERLTTSDGKEIEVWELQFTNESEILSSWASHFRNHYCRDSELDDLVAGTGLKKSEFLASIKFPDGKLPPGPGTRSGDFGEILVADFIEFVLGYWCPREGRYENRENRNVPSNGCDVLGFKFANDEPGSVDDELFILESKASLTPTKNNRLQDAVDDSVKDQVRRAMSLSAIKQRLIRSDKDRALWVQRFQNEADNPYRQINGAAAILEGDVFDAMDIRSTDASAYKTSNDLKLLIIKGTSMMKLVHHLYERAANEA